MSVDAISFSAHADYDQTHGFVSALKPPHIVLVHGEAGEMQRLRVALERSAVSERVERKLHTPKVVQTVSIPLAPRRVADMVGRLAQGAPKVGEALRGVLISRGRRDLVMHPADLPEFTKLNTGRVMHKQVGFWSVWAGSCLLVARLASIVWCCSRSTLCSLSHHVTCPPHPCHQPNRPSKPGHPLFQALLRPPTGP
jgi:hypothetical protein